MISNVVTEQKGRVDSDKNVSTSRMNRLVAKAKEHLPYDSLHVWNADIDGVIIQLRTNDDHLVDFWMENWFPAPHDGVRPHGVIYAAMGVPGEEPHAYYNTEMKTAVFFNTNYYGQCKSWALGIVADIMEMQHDVHSIHGACVDVEGTGLVIIAPTGTGKSTHSYGLTLGLPRVRMPSDDWLYVDYTGKDANAAISERKFYMRTDIAETYPQLGELFRRSKCENVVGGNFTAFGNSRAILDPYWIGGTEKFTKTTRIGAVVLLRRDNESPAEERLSAERAIEVLREGKYQVMPGAGKPEEIGSFKEEPWYNPYLLVRNRDREELQEGFFQHLFEAATCHILNTAVETVEESQQRIRRILRESTLIG